MSVIAFKNMSSSTELSKFWEWWRHAYSMHSNSKELYLSANGANDNSVLLLVLIN